MANQNTGFTSPCLLGRTFAHPNKGCKKNLRHYELTLFCLGLTMHSKSFAGVLGIHSFSVEVRLFMPCLSNFMLLMLTKCHAPNPALPLVSIIMVSLLSKEHDSSLLCGYMFNSTIIYSSWLYHPPANFPQFLLTAL